MYCSSLSALRLFSIVPYSLKIWHAWLGGWSGKGSDVKVVGLVVDWMELAGVDVLLAGATSGKLVLEVDRG